jgi:hypothetical protein
LLKANNPFTIILMAYSSKNSRLKFVHFCLRKNSQNRHRLGFAGMSLMETVIAMGIMTGGALMLANMTQQNQRSTTTAQSKMAFSQAVAWISSVVANDSSCKQALNLGSGLTYSPVSIPVKQLDDSGALISTTTNLDNAIPVSFYSTGGAVYLKNYVSSTDFTSLQQLKVLQVALLVQNPGAGLKVSGSTDTIYQALVYLTARKPNSALNASASLEDRTIPINLRVDSNNKVIDCTGFRLGNGTAVDLPKCDAGQVMWANGTSMTCVNLSCPPGWRPTSVSSDGGYMPPNIDLTKISNGALVGGVGGSSWSTLPGYNNADKSWRSGQGCTMCNPGQVTTSGGFDPNQPDSPGSVTCVNNGVCPVGWHLPQQTTEPGYQNPNTRLDTTANANITPSNNPGGLNLFSGWISTVGCVPGAGSPKACTPAALPYCPNTTRGADTCSYTLAAAGGGDYCTFPCGKGSPTSDCMLNKDNNGTLGHTSSTCTSFNTGTQNGKMAGRYCEFSGLSNCPGGWGYGEGNWDSKGCSGSGSVVWNCSWGTTDPGMNCSPTGNANKSTNQGWSDPAPTTNYNDFSCHAGNRSGCSFCYPSGACSPDYGGSWDTTQHTCTADTRTDVRCY